MIYPYLSFPGGCWVRFCTYSSPGVYAARGYLQVLGAPNLFPSKPAIPLREPPRIPYPRYPTPVKPPLKPIGPFPIKDTSRGVYSEGDRMGPNNPTVVEDHLGSKGEISKKQKPVKLSLRRILREVLDGYDKDKKGNRKKVALKVIEFMVHKFLTNQKIENPQIAKLIMEHIDGKPTQTIVEMAGPDDIFEGVKVEEMLQIAGYSLVDDDGKVKPRKVVEKKRRAKATAKAKKTKTKKKRKTARKRCAAKKEGE